MAMLYYSVHDRDRLALKLFKFNEFVRKTHPEQNIRFTIYKSHKEDPVYALKINGVEFYNYTYPTFDYETVQKLRYMTDEKIYNEIMSNPLPEW